MLCVTYKSGITKNNATSVKLCSQFWTSKYFAPARWPPQLSSTDDYRQFIILSIHLCGPHYRRDAARRVAGDVIGKSRENRSRVIRPVVVFEMCRPWWSFGCRRTADRCRRRPRSDSDRAPAHQALDSTTPGRSHHPSDVCGCTTRCSSSLVVPPRHSTSTTHVHTGSSTP